MSSYLGELVVKLSGDSASLNSEIDKSEKTLQKFSDSAKSIGGNLTKFVTLPILALGTAATKAFADAEDSETSFRAALKATGKEASISVDNMKALTSELQKVTTYEDDAQLKALGLVQSLSNLSEDGLKAILPRMLDFSAAMGLDLQTTASLFGKTIGSTTNALSRYGIQIEDGLEGDKKLLALTTALDSKFKDYAQTTAKLGTGPMKQLLNTLGDLAESFGEAILPVINELIPPIKVAIEQFSNLDINTKKMIITGAAFAAAAGPIVGAIGNIVGAATKLLPLLASIGPVIATIGVPIGVVVGSLTVLISEVLRYKKVADETIAIQQGFIKVMDGSKQSLDDFKKSLVVFETSPAILKKDLEAVNKAINETQKQIDAFSKGLVDQGPTKIFTFESERTDPLAKQRQEVARLREELEKLKATRDSLNQQLNKVAPTQKEEIKTYEYMTSLQDGLLSMKETELEILSKELEQKGLLLDVNSIMNEQIGVTLEKTQEEADAFNKLTESYKKYTDLVASVTGPVFEALGAALVTGEAGWKAFAKAGLDAVAAVVDALANMAIAETAAEVAKALASYPDPVGIATHSAAAAQWGAAGALGKVVAGAIRAIPFKDGGYVTKPTVGLLAEAGNPEFAIPDRPNVTDILATRILNGMGKMTGTVNNVTNNNQGFNGQMVLSIDGQQFKAYINQQSARGNIIVNKNRGISKR